MRLESEGKMRLLLATDGSEYSENAARFLTRFDFSPRDEIIVLHVITEIPYPDDYYANILRFLKKVSPRILKSSADVLKTVKAKVSVIEEEGAPDLTIMKVAEDSGADLIVLGARGVKGVKSFLIGSVTRSVAIKSSKPVLVTKIHPPQAETMKILFAADGSPSSLATAGLLAELPFPDEAELTVMNVAWAIASDIPERFVIEIDERVKEDVARARAAQYKESEKIIDRVMPHVSGRFSRVTAATKGGDPSLEILTEADTMRADLIALGSRGLRGIKGMLGSVSRRVLAHSQCAVLVGKAAEEEGAL